MVVVPNRYMIYIYFRHIAYTLQLVALCLVAPSITSWWPFQDVGAPLSLFLEVCLLYLRNRSLICNRFLLRKRERFKPP